MSGPKSTGIRVVGALLAGGFLWNGSVRAASRQVAVLHARVEGRPEASAPLRQLIESTHGPLDTCYRQALAKEPGLVGRLFLEVTVNGKGKITNVSVTRASTVPEELGACVTGALRGQAVSGWALSNPVVASVGLEFRLLGRVFKGVVARGGLKPEWLAGVFEVRAPELADCWPGGEGKKVLVSGVVRFNGSIQRVRARGRRVPRAVRACLERRLKTWRFPFGRGGHRTWFQYPVRLVRVGAHPAGRPGPRAGSAARPSRQAGASARAAGRPARRRSVSRAPGARSVAAPKVGLLEIRVGSARIPGGVDDKRLGLLLAKIVARMKRCGGLKWGMRFKMAIVVARDGRASLKMLGKSRAPRATWQCLARALRGRRFPVSVARPRGYQIQIEVRRPRPQQGLKGR